MIKVIEGCRPWVVFSSSFDPVLQMSGKGAQSGQRLKLLSLAQNNKKKNKCWSNKITPVI